MVNKQNAVRVIENEQSAARVIETPPMTLLRTQQITEEAK